MSLLTICQAVANSCGYAAPSAIVGNADDTAIQLLALISDAGDYLRRKPWQVLQMEHAFTTVNGTATYALPTDYGYYLNDTAWDRTNYWKMRGSLSPAKWQIYKSGIQTSTPRQRFRVRGGLVVIDPTPSAAYNLLIEYVSKNYILAGVTPQSTWTADTNTSQIDEYLLRLELKWRFLARKGLNYIEEKAEAEREIDKAIGQDVPSDSVNMAGDNESWPPLPNTPVTGYHN